MYKYVFKKTGFRKKLHVNLKNKNIGIYNILTAEKIYAGFVVAGAVANS